MTWKERSSQLEIIDLSPDHYSKEEYFECLLYLDRVGRWLGGDAATFRAIDRDKVSPQSILDVGCGGGLFTIRLAQRYPQTSVVGIDTNPLAIEFAQNSLKKMRRAPSNIRFIRATQPELNEQDKSYDFVLSTLMCHHLTEEQLLDFIRRAQRIAKRKFIINDLHRHPFAYYAFKMIAPLLFHNRLIEHDGPLSVKRAMTLKEWKLLLNRVPINHYKISWSWAFRWMIVIDCDEK